MLESESKIINRPSTTAGKQYDKLFIYIPTDLSKDSAFPFQPNEKIKIKITQKKKKEKYKKTKKSKKTIKKSL
jgi:hypothetical protein